MNRTVLPNPPNPSAFPKTDDWMRAVFNWMSQVKLKIEADSNVNTSPIAPYVLGTYTATNTITGTDATSNFVATLVAGMQAQGITAPVSQRINNA
jgi:hypothetical protein